MRNNRLLPYETIVQATSGEPEAVGTVLQYYRRRIQCAARVNGRVVQSIAIPHHTPTFLQCAYTLYLRDYDLFSSLCFFIVSF